MPGTDSSLPRGFASCAKRGWTRDSMIQTSSFIRKQEQEIEKKKHLLQFILSCLGKSCSLLVFAGILPWIRCRGGGREGMRGQGRRSPRRDQRDFSSSVPLLVPPYTLIVRKTSKPFRAVDMMSPGTCECQCSSLTSLDPWWMNSSCGGNLSN